jgi:hypothetical protein
MKKLLMVILLLLGLGAAGTGYYIFVMKPEQDALVAEALRKQNIGKDQSAKGSSTMDKSAPEDTKQVNIQYFVNKRRIGVRRLPSEDAFPVRYLYKSDPVTVREIKDGWGRISNYYVLKSGGTEYSEWVKMDSLIDWVPIITKEEKEEMLTSYIGKSDNFLLYKQKFFTITDKLIKEKICIPEDFEEVKGWMRSLKYKDRNVYFVYCGGMRVSDKIYFDVDSGEMFY